MLSHRAISLFDAPRGSLIVHACNSQGIWKSGIAKPFSEQYVEAYSEYRTFCATHNAARGTATGLAGMHVSSKEPHSVGWIVTSHDFADRKDSVEVIKVNTALALTKLCELVKQQGTSNREIYSNKFNSGLFGVEWKASELILQMVLRDFPFIHWIVCDPETDHDK